MPCGFASSEFPRELPYPAKFSPQLLDSQAEHPYRFMKTVSNLGADGL
jgi:hypothetical protein